MARRCSVCTHPKVVEINRAILESVPYWTIAERYGVHPSSLHRHKCNHLARAVEEAKRLRFEKSVEQASVVLRTLDKAIAQLEGRTDADSVGRLIRLLELRQRLLGKGKDTLELQIAWGKGLEKDA